LLRSWRTSCRVRFLASWAAKRTRLHSMSSAGAAEPTADRGAAEIELVSGADAPFPSADAFELLRMYVDIPGNALTEQVHRKCVDFNVRTLLVSNARLSTALKAWPIQLHFGMLGLMLVFYSLITVSHTHTHTHAHSTSATAHAVEWRARAVAEVECACVQGNFPWCGCDA